MIKLQGFKNEPGPGIEFINNYCLVKCFPEERLSLRAVAQFSSPDVGLQKVLLLLFVFFIFWAVKRMR